MTLDPSPAALDLACAALAAYALPAPTVEYVGASGSQTFRVRAGGESYLLRVHETRTTLFGAQRTPQHVRSELQWLTALARDTDLTVQTPIPTRTGALVVEVDGRTSSLLRWIEGEVPAQPVDEAHAKELGRLLATLHTHGSTWSRPAEFDLPEHDLQPLTRAVEILRAACDEGVITAAEFDVLERAAGLARERILELNPSPGTWGLIHGDLHEENHLVHAGKLRPIDFGLSGFGYFLYDAVEASLHLLPHVRPSLFDGYAEQRPLGPGYLPQIEAFFVLAVITGAAFHAETDETLAERAKYARTIAKHHLPRFLAGEPFIDRD